MGKISELKKNGCNCLNCLYNLSRDGLKFIVCAHRRYMIDYSDGDVCTKYRERNQEPKEDKQ